MTEFPYDTGYDPALPVCDIVMSAESTGRRLQLTAIIDTGADGTIVPIRHLEEIGARRVFEAGLRSQWGERRTVFLYLVNLQIGALNLPSIYVVGDEQGNEFIPKNVAASILQAVGWPFTWYVPSVSPS